MTSRFPASPQILITGLEQLASKVPLSTDPAILSAHLSDASRAVADGLPLAVASPTTTAQVAAALSWANEHRVPVSIRGAGSGLSGGAIAYAGGLAISMTAFDSVEIDPVNMLATVGAGVITAELDHAAQAHGLIYAPDPVSSELSTIGGNIATNAGGPRCLAHGVTADAVVSLEVVLADGRVIRSGSKTVKNTSGLNLMPLFVGSEGTLGVITNAVVRLKPQPRGSRVAFAASFPTLEDAGSAIVQILASLPRPESLELMDANTLAAVASHYPDEPAVPGAAAIVGEFISENAEALATQLGEVCVAHDAAVMYGEAAGALLRTRLRVNPALSASGLVASCDVAVPISELAHLMMRIEEVSEQFGMQINAFAHAGDGNFHPTVVVPPEDPDALDRAELVLDAITHAALELGGVISGEHGIGSLKVHHLEEQLGPETLRLQRELKQFFDPNGILAPGRAI